jgi:hypothetical protein
MAALFRGRGYAARTLLKVPARERSEKKDWPPILWMAVSFKGRPTFPDRKGVRFRSCSASPKHRPKLFEILWKYVFGENLVAPSGNEDVVLDAYSTGWDLADLFREIESRLYGDYHAFLENQSLGVGLRGNIVHVDPKHVADPMRKVGFVGPLFVEFCGVALEHSKLFESAG